MKRFICALIIALSLCGCTDSKKEVSLNYESLNTEFKAEIDGNIYKGYISLDKGKNMLVAMTYPDLISGVSYTFCEDTVISSIDNIDSTYKMKDLPENFAFLKLYNAIKEITAQDSFVKKSDKAYEKLSQGVTLITDEKGNLTSASLKSGTITFG